MSDPAAIVNDHGAWYSSMEKFCGAWRGRRAMSMPTTYPAANPESVFTYAAPQLKFGSGAAEEIGSTST